MAAALELARDHAVTLIESETRLGGHARTVIAGKNGDQPVDTGFIVFNKVNYPHLVALFDRLDVPIADSDMTFAASLRGGRLEYSTRTVDTLFAQRRNLLHPRFMGMVRDIMRFNANAAEARKDGSMSLREFLDSLGLGHAFREWYLGPISGAIWSTPRSEIMDFPAEAMIRFFDNHNLLHHSGQHAWFTVKGGSIEYVRRLEAELRRLGVEIRTGAPVQAVTRAHGGAQVKLDGAEWDSFDEVILATHADVSLRLLADADPEEQAILSRIRTQPNEAVLHSDPAQMPRNRKCWACWNYVEGDTPPERIGLTYWMNELQPIPKDDPLFVTLNPQTPIREDLIHDVTTFRHPLYDLPMLSAVEELKARNGTRGTWYCGAWMRNGFHEDGYASAVAVARAMARRDAVDAAA
ncbi:hypothetical protein jaqu_29300 [Jannaschia aquimarina]|uniref:Amine oxidase domain-containing protein n=2 Tax=Jannaschia aquimarina TaxID=935700 RepID=A0A0D1EHP4_9RHOB|nr:hypothetical protein jaqu_29300 [Jannaschia aquimarina]SNS51077.1 hypothetical protein SAMN05421775_101244 [Jannaschia aquimarina]